MASEEGPDLTISVPTICTDSIIEDNSSPVVANVPAVTFKNGKTNIGIVPKSSAMLGADLSPSVNSLLMPPPKLNVVKKTRLLVNPGKSMVEWMKFQQELSTRSSSIRLRKIGMDELSTHNTEEDAWMALNDKVYDVTDYIRYHPGGVEEIMKGAGQDATNLFNQIHRWVNFESILKGNMLGYLVKYPTLSLLQARALKIITSDSNSSQKTERDSIHINFPTTSFSEDDSALYLEVDSDSDDLSQECWTVGVLNSERLLLKLLIKPPDLWILHFKLLKALKEEKIRLTFNSNFKSAKITLRKPSSEKWNVIGAPLKYNNELIDSRKAIEDFHPAKIVVKESLTHNVFMFYIEIPKSVVLGIPLGFHVKLRLNGSMFRKYTPTCKTLLGEETDNNDQESNRCEIIYFIIKIYSQGLFTSKLSNMNLQTNKLEIGCCEGTFNPDFFLDTKTVCIFAAGSGITPFTRIIKHLYLRKSELEVRNVILLFFNETVNDIIWDSEWKKLALLEPSWFHYFPVISKCTETWDGLHGRVSEELFESCLNMVHLKQKPEIEAFGTSKAMICGSYGFNEACRRVIKSQKVLSIKDPSGVFVFTG